MVKIVKFCCRLPILAGAAGAFGCFTLYHNGWFLSCYAIWPDLCIASYKVCYLLLWLTILRVFRPFTQNFAFSSLLVDHTCLAKCYFVCFQTCLLPEFFFFVSLALFFSSIKCCLESVVWTTINQHFFPSFSCMNNT